MRVALYEAATGRILFVMQCTAVQAADTAGPGQMVVELLEGDDSTHYIVDGQPVAFPAKPHPTAVWDWTTKAWASDLPAAKAAKWEEIKAARTRAEYGGFVFNSVPYDSDETSTQRIIGAVSMAQIALANAQPFSIDWTLADNTVTTLDAIGMISVGVALGQHVAAIHAQARTLRADIEAATTLEEIDAVIW
jgi:hypothetical protein